MSDGQPRRAEDVTRPQTSVRDLDEVREGLEAWLKDRLPTAANPSIACLDAPAGNGMSSDTFLFEAIWSDAGVERVRHLVARVAPEPSAVTLFPVYDLPRQFEVMRKVSELSRVPVPEVLWCEPGKGAIGAPFFVMERVEGLVPPDVMPYDFGGNWLGDSSPDQQARLQHSSVEILARVHSIPQPEKSFEILQLDRPEPSPLGRHVADQRDLYGWAFGGRRSPLIEACFAWLEDHWPDQEGAPVLCWGDARIGNIIYRDFEPVAVLDWEMAALGPRELDVGWFVFLHRFFEDIAATFELPGMPGFLRRGDVARTYTTLTGCELRDLDFYTMYAAVRHGIIMARTKLRQVHFGEEEMPADPDDLIMHRAALEAMIEGTYWSSLPDQASRTKPPGPSPW